MSIKIGRESTSKSVVEKKISIVPARRKIVCATSVCKFNVEAHITCETTLLWLCTEEN